MGVLIDLINAFRLSVYEKKNTSTIKAQEWQLYGRGIDFKWFKVQTCIQIRVNLHFETKEYLTKPFLVHLSRYHRLIVSPAHQVITDCQRYLQKYSLRIGEE